MPYSEAAYISLNCVCSGCGSALVVVPVKDRAQMVVGFSVVCITCRDRLPGYQPQLHTGFQQVNQSFDEAAITRFWCYVYIPKRSDGSIDFDACWNWTRSVDSHNYGWYRDNRVWRSNRYAYAVSHRYDPLISGMVVSHTCDNPSCCNVMHLNQASYRSNSLDTFIRNRGRRKMDVGSVHRLLRDRRAGMSANQLAEKYGIGAWQALAIVKGYSWSFVRDDLSPDQIPKRKKSVKRRRSDQSNQSKSNES